MRRATTLLLASLAVAGGVAAACSSSPSGSDTHDAATDATSADGGPDGKAAGKANDAGPDVRDARPARDATTQDAASLPPLESHAPALIPLATQLDATSAPLVFDRGRGIVWTANGDVGTVSYVGVDHDAQRVLDEIAVGKDIRSVALSPDGFLAGGRGPRGCPRRAHRCRHAHGPSMARRRDPPARSRLECRRSALALRHARGRRCGRGHRPDAGRRRTDDRSRPDPRRSRGVAATPGALRHAPHRPERHQPLARLADDRQRDRARRPTPHDPADDAARKAVRVRQRRLVRRRQHDVVAARAPRADPSFQVHRDAFPGHQRRGLQRQRAGSSDGPQRSGGRDRGAEAALRRHRLARYDVEQRDRLPAVRRGDAPERPRGVCPRVRQRRPPHVRPHAGRGRRDRPQSSRRAPGRHGPRSDGRARLRPLGPIAEPADLRPRRRRPSRPGRRHRRPLAGRGQGPRRSRPPRGAHRVRQRELERAGPAHDGKQLDRLRGLPPGRLRVTDASPLRIGVRRRRVEGRAHRAQRFEGPLLDGTDPDDRRVRSPRRPRGAGGAGWARARPHRSGPHRRRRPKPPRCCRRQACEPDRTGHRA